jgi:Coatomer WD associated region
MRPCGVLQELCDKARANNRFNVAFLAAFMLQDADACLDVLVGCGRLPEAAFFARTYCPSRCSEMLQLWKADLARVNSRAAASLADPAEYPNLFPDWDVALSVESQWEAARAAPPQRACMYPSVEGWCARDLIAMVCSRTCSAASHACSTCAQAAFMYRQARRASLCLAPPALRHCLTPPALAGKGGQAAV